MMILLGVKRLNLALLAVLLQGCSPSDGLHSNSRPSMSPDGRFIVASVNTAGSSQVFKFPTGGGRGQKLSGGLKATDPAISADGKSLAFVVSERSKQGRIWLGHIESPSYQPLEPEPVAEQSMDALPTFLSDGRLIFFRSTNLRTTSTFGSRWTEWKMYVWDPKDRQTTRVSAESYYGVLGAAACGMSVFVGLDGPEEPIVRKVDFASGAGMRIDREWRSISNPSPFKDCDKFVAVANVGESDSTGFYRYELILKNVISSTQKQLTNRASYIASPIVAPSGEFVLFLSDPERDGTFELEEMIVRTGETKTIALVWD